MILKKYIPQDHEKLELERFKTMDYLAVDQGLPIALMMEQAGFNLARMAVAFAPHAKSFIVGAGPGNNGGGGLVAARRLHAWGFDVTLHLPFDKGNELQQSHLERAKLLGIGATPNWDTDVLIDAYFGFSQRLPLPESLQEHIAFVNKQAFKRISLDLPTGIGSKEEVSANAILCLASPKTILDPYIGKTPVWVADLGIDFEIYRQFGFDHPLPFAGIGVFEWVDHAERVIPF